MIKSVEVRFPTGIMNRAFVTLNSHDGTFTTDMPPRLARVLLILAEEQHLQAGLVAPAEGWLSREQIAERVEAMTEWPIAKGSVTSYVTALLKRLKAAAHRELTPDEVGLSIASQARRGETARHDAYPDSSDAGFVSARAAMLKQRGVDSSV